MGDLDLAFATRTGTAVIGQGIAGLFECHQDGVPVGAINRFAGGLHDDASHFFFPLVLSLLCCGKAGAPCEEPAGIPFNTFLKPVVTPAFGRDDGATHQNTGMMSSMSMSDTSWPVMPTSGMAGNGML